MMPLVASPVIWPARLFGDPSANRLNSTLPSGVIDPITVKLPTSLPSGAAPGPQ